MKAINKPGDNLGGLLKIYAVPSSVYSISGKTVTFLDTSNVYEIYCTPDSMQFSELSEKTEAGIHFNTAVSGFIPRDSSDVLEAISDMEGKPYIIIFKDGNGNFKLAGTNTQPLRISANLDTGRQIIDRAGYQFEFSGRTISRAIFIDDPF